MITRIFLEFYPAVKSGRSLPTLRRRVLLPSSGSKTKSSKKKAINGTLLSSLFDPEDGGSTFFSNVGQNLPDYTTSHSKI
jgi:hypothetical protein